jgi:hypothetical protein
MCRMMRTSVMVARVKVPSENTQFRLPIRAKYLWYSHFALFLG